MIYCIKAFDRPINKAPAKPCLSRHSFQFSFNNNKTYGVLNLVMYPQRNGERNFLI